VGFASWDGSESAAHLIGRADRALYRAKARGRDRLDFSEARADAPAWSQPKAS
jgi:PleD family two-component response regulator